MTPRNPTVCGNVAAAEQGRLTMMLGATRDELVPALPAIEAVSDQEFFLGTVGAGAAVKLANNVFSILNTFAVYEAFRLANAYGLGHAELIAVCQASSGSSKALINFEKFDWSMREHTLADSAEIYHLVSKDLEMASAAARHAGVELAYVDVATAMTPSLLERRRRELGLDLIGAPDDA